MSPYDELTELRSMLTVQEIAEVTGVRRETLSRARPDSRLQRRTQKALDDLYAVVSRLSPTMGVDPVHLAAVMRRPQAALAQRSIAELLQEGRAAEVLEHLDLSEPDPTELEQLKNIRFAPEILAQLTPTPTDADPRVQAKLVEEERRVAALLDADPDLASRLPAIEAKIHEHFGADARIRRSVIAEYDDPEGGDGLYLGVCTGLSFDEEIERLGKLLVSSDDLLEPVRERLTIGNL
jgi:hypothetical protein